MPDPIADAANVAKAAKEAGISSILNYIYTLFVFLMSLGALFFGLFVGKKRAEVEIKPESPLTIADLRKYGEDAKDRELFSEIDRISNELRRLSDRIEGLDDKVEAIDRGQQHTPLLLTVAFNEKTALEDTRRMIEESHSKVQPKRRRARGHGETFSE